jgi:hypothetical protein
MISIAGLERDYSPSGKQHARVARVRNAGVR